MLFMLNRELMVRGDAVRENQSLVSFRKSCIARLERKLAECRSRKKQLQTEADALYESYALGAVQAVVDTFIKRIYMRILYGLFYLTLIYRQFGSNLALINRTPHEVMRVSAILAPKK